TITTAMGWRVIDGAKGAAITVTSLVGGAIADQTIGGTNNANLILGTTTAPSGTWSLYNVSIQNNYFNGNILVNTVTAPSSWAKRFAMVNGTAASANLTDG